jgi:hypothetical protein
MNMGGAITTERLNPRYGSLEGTGANEVPVVALTCPPKPDPKDKLGLEQKGGRQNAKETVFI